MDGDLNSCSQRRASEVTTAKKTGRDLKQGREREREE